MNLLFFNRSFIKYILLILGFNIYLLRELSFPRSLFLVVLRVTSYYPLSYNSVVVHPHQTSVSYLVFEVSDLLMQCCQSVCLVQPLWCWAINFIGCLPSNLGPKIFFVLGPYYSIILFVWTIFVPLYWSYPGASLVTPILWLAPLGAGILTLPRYGIFFTHLRVGEENLMLSRSSFITKLLPLLV